MFLFKDLKINRYTPEQKGTFEKMADYSKAKIYQIKNTINDDIYVGSTCAPLATRMTKHKYNGTRDKGHALFNLFAEHGVDKFYIELIEEYPCNTKQDLLAREGHYIRERGTINKRIAGRTRTQWHEEHKEEQATKNKEWYTAHREERKLKNKEYREANKEYLKEKSKEYKEANKDRIAEYKKQWADDNKERLQAKHAEYWHTEIDCECGMKIKRNGKWHHMKSKKHVELMKQKENPQE